MSTKNECICEVNLFVMYVLDLSVFFTEHSTFSRSKGQMCAFGFVCVCMCHYPYPQEDQCRTASRFYTGLVALETPH